jgi:hypothetical protein
LDTYKSYLFAFSVARLGAQTPPVNMAKLSVESLFAVALGTQDGKNSAAAIRSRTKLLADVKDALGN